MKKVSKSTLKAKMFEYFRELEKDGGELVVTDFGKPVFKIVPYKEKLTSSEVFKDLRGKSKFDKKSILEPTEAEWDQV